MTLYLFKISKFFYSKCFSRPCGLLVFLHSIQQLTTFWATVICSQLSMGFSCCAYNNIGELQLFYIHQIFQQGRVGLTGTQIYILHVFFFFFDLMLNLYVDSDFNLPKHKKILKKKDILDSSKPDLSNSCYKVSNTLMFIGVNWDICG